MKPFVLVYYIVCKELRLRIQENTGTKGNAWRGCGRPRLPPDSLKLSFPSKCSELILVERNRQKSPHLYTTGTLALISTWNMG